MLGVPEDDRRKQQPARRARRDRAKARSASAAAWERATSQIRIAGPKNSAVYFDSSAQPAAAPTASHHTPRPVCSTLASANSTKLEATSSGASGVTIMVPTAAISVTFSRIADGRGHAPAAEQHGGGLIDRPAHRQRQQDRDQPHAELGIACDHRAEPDHHRDA